MPELPEVETTRRGIAPHTVGHTIASMTIRQPRLRWPIDENLPELLVGQQLLSLGRRGKYLLFEFETGHLLVHLGMSGSLRIVDANSSPALKHDHVDLVFNPRCCLRYHDPRRFGAMIWTEEDPFQHSLLAKLGPEPLSSAFDGPYLFNKSRKSSRDIKSFVMDSHIVVGVGNIYANEALYHAGIRPTKAVKRVTGTQCARLAEEVKKVLQRSIDQGGTTLRDFVGGDGKPGYFAQQLSVYGRQGQACNQCGKPLKSIRQAQRITVYCTQCQT